MVVFHNQMFKPSVARHVKASRSPSNEEIFWHHGVKNFRIIM